MKSFEISDNNIKDNVWDAQKEYNTLYYIKNQLFKIISTFRELSDENTLNYIESNT